MFIKYFGLLILLYSSMFEVASSVNRDNLENYQLFRQCGTEDSSKSNINLRIFNGETAERYEAPWKSAIFLKIEKKYEFICGGTLISNDLIITAAHCVRDKNYNLNLKAEYLRVLLGANNIKNPETGSEFQYIMKLIIHEKWQTESDSRSYKHDIAILKLFSHIKFSRYIQPLCLLTTKFNNNFTKGKIVAWGVTDDKNNISELAVKADLKLFNYTQCVQNNNGIAVIAGEESFCAKSDDAGVCKGDSGSGLYVKIGEKYYLKGMVSAQSTMKNTTCSNKVEAIYIDMPYYYDFIMENAVLSLNILKMNCYETNTTSKWDYFPKRNYYECKAKLKNYSTDKINGISTNIIQNNKEKEVHSILFEDMKILPFFKKDLLKSHFPKLFKVTLHMNNDPKLNQDLSNFVGNLGNIGALVLVKCVLDNNLEQVFNENDDLERIFMFYCSLPNGLLQNTLTKLVRIKHFYLANSKLEVLPPGIFKNNINMAYLNLNNNEIKVLPENIFDPLEHLKELSLQGNKIEVLLKNIFSKLYSMEKLFIYGNKISVITVEMFKDNHQLREADFRFNKINNQTKDELIRSYSYFKF